MTSSATTTTREQFDDALKSGFDVVPVIRQVFADGETPVAIYRKLGAGLPGSFLLESAEQGGIWSRFSFVGMSSFGVLSESAGIATWSANGLDEETAFGGSIPTQTLDALRALYSRWKSKPVRGLPALASGLVGYLGWDTVRQLEKLPHAPIADVRVPEVALSFARDLVVLDHKWGTLLLVTNVLASGADWDEAQQRLDAIQAQMAAPGSTGLATIDLTASLTPTYRTNKQDFLDAVVTSKKHIVAGDVFQVVIS
ncbi:MAG: hypothetical protein RLZZ600_1210, partial [Actinomycetota bacterium]